MNDFIYTIDSILEEKIKESIQKEISLLRELLSNFLQEKSFLLNHDKSNWSLLMENRFLLMEDVKSLRHNRSLKYDPLKTSSCDTLFLTDQLVALLQKIHEQASHNDILLAQNGLQPRGISTPEKLTLIPTKKSSLSTLSVIP